MRGLHLASLGLLILVSGATMLACSSDAEDCEKNRTCGGATTQGGSSSSSTGGPPSACIPGPDNTQVGAECGIFASTTGDDTADGSQAAPVKSLKKAVELATSQGEKAIYACTGDYAESIELPGGISLFGGLDCAANWKYVDSMTRSSIQGSADEIPLKIVGSGTVNVGNINVTAADALLPGGSSIAALVDGASVNWAYVRLTAGAAANGADGTTPDPVGATDPMDPSIAGNAGVVACGMADVDNPGGMEKANPTCNTAIGGMGGNGLVDSGTAGADGLPLPNPNPDAWGVGGTGASGNTPCKPGQVGLVGSDGTAGAGAAGVGAISASGFTGVSGSDGTPGAPGQGGGGGGGAKGKMGCAGASGGGGGAGGCGGPGGLGGKSGGSSIALISLNATMTFNLVDLSALAGGKGGNGGDGQNGSLGGYGGLGGLGATGTLKGCTGGDGGAGGFGGKGGGGAGGHSIGIAYTGSAPALDGVSIQKGAAGAGGTGMDAAGSGAGGVSMDTQAF